MKFFLMDAVCPREEVPMCFSVPVLVFGFIASLILSGVGCYLMKGVCDKKGGK